jgi:hypothetical protein
VARLVTKVKGKIIIGLLRCSRENLALDGKDKQTYLVGVGFGIVMSSKSDTLVNDQKRE